MKCPKCGQENSDALQFCTRCHATLKYICPACKHAQLQGGQCEKCGVDFAKYALMMQTKAKDDVDREIAQGRERASLVRNLMMAPISGWLSLFRYVRSRLLGD
jgi:ribosomal protein L37AE/L43A